MNSLEKRNTVCWDKISLGKVGGGFNGDTFLLRSELDMKKAEKIEKYSNLLKQNGLGEWAE